MRKENWRSWEPIRCSKGVVAVRCAEGKKEENVQEDRNVGAGERRRVLIPGRLNSPAGEDGKKKKEEVFWEHFS